MEGVLQLLVLAILGLLGGVLAGVVGVGGAAIFIPALVYVVGWGIKEAVAASLVIIIFASLTGTWRNSKSEDPVHWKTALILSSTVAPATLIGVYISTVSPSVVVEIAFAALLLALAYPTARGRPNFDESSKKIPVPLVLLAGLFIGRSRAWWGSAAGSCLYP